MTVLSKTISTRTSNSAQARTGDDPVSRVSGKVRSLFNFIHPHDADAVNECIIALKHWGALQGGMLSDGGFAYIKFRLLFSGRGANVYPQFVVPPTFASSYSR